MMWHRTALADSGPPDTGRRARAVRNRFLALCCFVTALLLAGCRTGSKTDLAAPRPFSFETDTFAYANELVWEYHSDPETGHTTHTRRTPPPAYTHHCFVVARSAAQFFARARFVPALPRIAPAEYRSLIRKVVSSSLRRRTTPEERIVIPGYAHLREFSADHDIALQEECGGAWQSYFQRGHWRMLLPLTRSHQQRMAGQLVESVRRNEPVVVHVVRFPSLAINHALMLYGVEEDPDEIRFEVYDPNSVEAPRELTYHREERRFTYPRNCYFEGGRVDVYQIFHKWNY